VRFGFKNALAVHRLLRSFDGVRYRFFKDMQVAAVGCLNRILYRAAEGCPALKLGEQNPLDLQAGVDVASYPTDKRLVLQL
jgi:hypothetical protein